MPFLAAAPALAGAAGAAGTAAAGTAAATAAAAAPALAATTAAAAAPALAAGTAAAAAPAAAGLAGAAGTGAAGLGGAGGGMMAAGAPTGMGVFGTSPTAALGSGMGSGGSGVLGSSSALGMPAAPTGFGASLPSQGVLGQSPALGYGSSGGTPFYSGGGMGANAPSAGQFAGIGPVGSPAGAPSSPSFFDQVSGMYDKVTNHPAFKTGKEALNMASNFEQTFGPNGSARKGDLSGMMKGAEGMMGSAKNIGELWNPSSSTTGKSGGEVGSLGTTQSAFGLSPEQFASIPPEVKQEMLRKLGGR